MRANRGWALGLFLPALCCEKAVFEILLDYMYNISDFTAATTPKQHVVPLLKLAKVLRVKAAHTALLGILQETLGVAQRELLMVAVVMPLRRPAATMTTCLS